MPVLIVMFYAICGAAGIIFLLVMKSGLLAWYDTGGVGSLLVGAAGAAFALGSN
jgi:hypothetical protein